jgi:CBS domain-containing protein
MDLTIPVSTVMSTNVTAVAPHQKLVDLKHIFERKIFYHHIPVIENNSLVGIVSLVDFMRGIGFAGLEDEDPTYQEKYVKEIMTINPEWIDAHEPLVKAVKILAEGKVHALIVLDNQKVVGIISTSDLLKFMLKNALN